MIKSKSKVSSTTKAELATVSQFHWQAFLSENTNYRMNLLDINSQISFQGLNSIFKD